MPRFIFAISGWSYLVRAASVWKNLNLVHRAQTISETYFRLAVGKWCKLFDLGLVLRYARFSLLMIVLGFFVLFLSGQGRELALRLDHNPAHAFSFYMGLMLWALQTWFCTRRILDYRFGRPDPAIHSLLAWSVNHVPRILGALAFFEAAGSLFFAWSQKGYPFNSLHFFLLILTIASAIVFYWFTIHRRQWMQRFCKGFNPNTESGDDLEYLYRPLRRFTMIYSTILILTAFTIPATLGAWLGSLGILFLAFSSIVPAGSWLILFSEKLLDRQFESTVPHSDTAPKVAGFPVISALFLLAFVFSFFNDNHGIRVLGEPQPRPDLTDALQQWQSQAPLIHDYQPLMIVATAGGGIRASRWTANILGALTDADPQFQKALFAISSVSGGSVGAAFYQAALLADACRQEQNCYQQHLQLALSQDFLAPNLANMLFPDLMQRFLPPLGLPDRQTALEKGWERAWNKQFESAQGLDLQQPFSAAGGTSKHGWVPILLFNGTHMETGKRIVAASIKLEPKDFVDTLDLLALTGKDLRLSTAAGNSARFPYISPVGTLPCKPEGSILNRLVNYFFCRNGHIADGGYFENYGAITAMETMKATLQSIRSPKKIKPVFILISSDPDLGCSPERRKKHIKQCQFIDEDTLPPRLKHKSGGNETFGPINTLFSTRSARGILAAKNLRLWVESCRDEPSRCGVASTPEFIHFRMEVPEGSPEPALGWLLSKESETDIDRMIACSNHNRGAFEKVLKILGKATAPAHAALSCPKPN